MQPIPYENNRRGGWMLHHGPIIQAIDNNFDYTGSKINSLNNCITELNKLDQNLSNQIDVLMQQIETTKADIIKLQESNSKTKSRLDEIHNRLKTKNIELYDNSQYYKKITDDHTTRIKIFGERLKNMLDTIPVFVQNISSWSEKFINHIKCKTLAQLEEPIFQDNIILLKN